jgi:hypothetical protein
MSDEQIAAFPLCWPEGWKRTPASKRPSGSRFGDPSIYDCCQKLKKELSLLGAKEIIISTSVPLRRDGIPLAKPPVDGDPGAAVYFTKGGRSQCIAIDTYPRVEHNLRALALTVEAMRAIDRWGGAEILDRAFTGFAALPGRFEWWMVLGVPRSASREIVQQAYRRLVKQHDPDLGGSHEAMAEINRAFEEAKQVTK